MEFNRIASGIGKEFDLSACNTTLEICDEECKAA